MRYTVKSPATVLTIIILGLSTLFYLVFTTNINIYKTYEGIVVVENDTVYIESVLDEGNINEPIYWYIDKQVALYDIGGYEISEKDRGYKIRAFPLQENTSIVLGKETVYIDIPVSKITLLSRIFSKGDGINE